MSAKRYTIKPLHWRRITCRDEGTIYTADTVVGTYTVMSGAHRKYLGDGSGRKKFQPAWRYDANDERNYTGPTEVPTIAHGKAAAQADFEAFITRDLAEVPS